MPVLIVILSSAVGLLLYTWAGYPLLLAVVGDRARKRVPDTRRDGRSFHLSAILSAFNEEAVIAARLANLISLADSLPASARWHLLVGVDGATDRTGELAREIARRDSRVQVYDFKQRRGKVTVLKDLVAAARQLEAGATGENVARVLVFTDANTCFKPDALDRLLAHFADRKVGGVCGRLAFVKGPQPAGEAAIGPADSGPAASATGESPEAAYWDWETWLKRRESALDSCLGANGAIYAIREELFWEQIPSNTIVDDFVIGMKIREQGFRMIYEPAAVAEEEFPEVASEWTRRVRIGSGDFQALALCRRCLGPRFGWFAWMFWSHKVLRWFTPHLGLVAFASALLALIVMAAQDPDPWRFRPSAWLPLLTVFGFAALVACAGLGRLLRSSTGGSARLFRLCDHFVTMQAALFAGFLRWTRGNLTGHWARTPR